MRLQQCFEAMSESEWCECGSVGSGHISIGCTYEVIIIGGNSESYYVYSLFYDSTVLQEIYYFSFNYYIKFASLFIELFSYFVH